MVGFGTETVRMARIAGCGRRAGKTDVRISRRPWASESGSALADDVCRR